MVPSVEYFYDACAVQMVVMVMAYDYQVYIGQAI